MDLSNRLRPPIFFLITNMIHTILVAFIFVLFFVFHIKNLIDAIKESNRIWIINSIVLLVFGILFVIYYLCHSL